MKSGRRKVECSTIKFEKSLVCFKTRAFSESYLSLMSNISNAWHRSRSMDTNLALNSKRRQRFYNNSLQNISNDYNREGHIPRRLPLTIDHQRIINVTTTTAQERECQQEQ